MRTITLLLALAAAAPAVAQTVAVGEVYPVTLQDVYQECQRHALDDAPAGHYDLGYESCATINAAWPASAEFQRQIQARDALQAGGPAMINQFLKGSGLDK